MPRGRGELGVDGGPTVPGEALDRGSGDQGDDPAGVDLADAVDSRLGEVDLAVGPQCQGAGSHSSAASAGPPSPALPCRAVPDDRRDDPVGCDLRIRSLLVSAIKRLPAAS